MSKVGSPKKRRKKNLKNMSIKELDEELKLIGDHKIKLEVKLNELEELENFVEAKKVHEKLKELNLLEGLYLERKVKVNQEKEVREIEEHHIDEMERFNVFWTDKMNAYETTVREQMMNTLTRQKEEEKDIFENIKKQLMHKKIKYSRKILEMKKQIKLLVERKKYVEAEEIQKKIKPIELSEMEKHHEAQEQTLKSKMGLVQKRHEAEINALKQKIDQKRNELRKKKELAFRRLVSKQQNLTKAVDLNHRKYFSEYKAVIERETRVLKSSTKNIVDYSNKFNKLGMTSQTPTSQYGYIFRAGRRSSLGKSTPKKRTPKKVTSTKKSPMKKKRTPRSGKRKKKSPKKKNLNFDTFDEFEKFQDKMKF